MWVYKLRLIFSNMSWLSERDRIWWKYQNYPSVVSYHAIQFFSYIMSQMSNGYGIMSKPNTYLYVSQSEGDELIDDILKISF